MRLRVEFQVIVVYERISKGRGFSRGDWEGQRGRKIRGKCIVGVKRGSCVKEWLVVLDEGYKFQDSSSSVFIGVGYQRDSGVFVGVVFLVEY